MSDEHRPRDRPPPRGPPPDDQPALRLPPLGGATLLATLLQHPRPVAHARAIAILRDVAHAVDLLAHAGRVYGAISPTTIAVDADGRARLVPPEDVEVLRPAYLAPEQRVGVRSGPAVDQYALAVVARELLAGVDVGSWSAVRRALATDPAARFPSAIAFVEALAAQLDLPPVTPSPDDVVAARAVAARLARAARPAEGASAPRRRWRGIVLEALAIAGIAVAILALQRGARWVAWPWRWGGEPAPVVAPSGFVRVRADDASDPDDGRAAILLDGRVVDTTPAVVAVRPGVHRVALRATGGGYVPPVVTVRVVAGDTARVAFTRP